MWGQLGPKEKRVHLGLLVVSVLKVRQAPPAPPARSLWVFRVLRGRPAHKAILVPG